MKEALPTTHTLIKFHNEHPIFETEEDDHHVYTSFNPKPLFKHGRETVVDKESMRLGQVDDLHKAIDHTTTAIGSATLYRSLTQPPQDVETVWDKQQSVSELQNNDKLRNAVEEYLGHIAEGETALIRFVNNEIYHMNPYPVFKPAVKNGAAIAEAADAIPTPESPYLQRVIEDLHDFKTSSVYRLMRGPIYQTLMGLRPREDVRWWTPRVRFVPTRLTIESFVPVLSLLTLIKLRDAGIISQATIQDPKFLLPVAFFATTPMITMMMWYMKPSFDHGFVVEPLREKAVADDSFGKAVDAVGKLDELVSFVRYSENAAPHATTPVVTDEASHSFVARDLKNPILGITTLGFVPNDIDLSDERLTFITGPNSGGKTTISKSIFQSQLLAQIGSDILARSAAINMADRLSYQAPRFDSLTDSEGRFGTELTRTRDIFFQSTPKSLVIMDELAEGTTSEEKMQVSRDVLDGFLSVGNTTILVTHNHELVFSFRDANKGQYWQVEFKGDTPTYRIVEGISTVSHADKIAQKIGFSKADIRRHLREQGYKAL